MQRIAVFCLFICWLSGQVVFARTAPVPAASDTVLQTNVADSIDPGSLTRLSDFKSIWEITRLAGGLRWVIILVLVFGLASMMYRYADFWIDRRKGAPIAEVNAKSASLRHIEHTVQNAPNNWLHQVYMNMLNVYRSTGSAVDVHYEITNFVQLQQDKFATFQGRIAFLSDTAGALGLLGTVWGMFVTFFRGNLDNQVILHGMGLALVTTLMGLVVSILLNFFSTQLQGAFRKKVDHVLNKGEELRLRLLVSQQQVRAQTKAVHIEPQSAEKEEVTQIVDEYENQTVTARSLKIAAVNGDMQVATVNTRLKKPFQVQVHDDDGNGVMHQLVTFEIENGNGTFKNGSKLDEVLTNEAGIAETQMILGNTAGTNLVRARLNNNGKLVRFQAIGKPAAPATLQYVSGNHQNLPAGQELKEPFVVRLLDCFANPISGHPVTFKVKMGKGYFPGNRNSYVAETDADGYARSYFTLNTDPGFNSIVVTAKGLRRARIEFEVLGQ